MNFLTIQRLSTGHFYSTKDRFHKSEPPRLYNRKSDAERSIRAYCRRASSGPADAAHLRLNFRIVPVTLLVELRAAQLALDLPRQPVMNRLKR